MKQVLRGIKFVLDPKLISVRLSLHLIVASHN